MNTWSQQFDELHVKNQDILDFKNIDSYQHDQHEH
jgi:hypothetical protein